MVRIEIRRIAGQDDAPSHRGAEPIGDGLKRSRAVAATIGTALVTLLLAGCSAPEQACSTMLYFSTLKITVEGQTPDTLELCRADLCAPSREASDSGFTITQPAVSGQQWTFTGTFPDDLTARAYNSDGAVIADVEVAPNWQRTGGSAQCGGPMRADATIRT